MVSEPVKWGLRHLHDGDLGVQEAVDGVLHPVRDPVGSLPHLDHQRERRWSLPLQHTLLCPPRPRLLITCMPRISNQHPRPGIL